MKTVCVMFDSLNRLALECYGGKRIDTPNFNRLAARAVSFDNHYVGSMPCMPARRDLMTGRLSFLHRSWGPLEPFDSTFPEHLHTEKNVYSHLVTDHFHYWEDGGANYHNRFDSFEFIRGQEGDRWAAEVEPDWETLNGEIHPAQASAKRREYKAQYILNRQSFVEESSYPITQSFDSGLAFLEKNRGAEDWYLQIETFDPHEPFHVPDHYRGKPRWSKGARDWPRYGRVDELPDEAEELRENYYALVRMCDAHLGRLLDYFDDHDLWHDTALIVTTDHGFLLGEHDFWAKNRMTLYEEIARIPLFFHDPRAPAPGTRSDVLTQTPDLAATVCELFACSAPENSMGLALADQLAGQLDRDAVLFGYFGGAVNLSTGRYTYHRYPPELESQQVFQYTLMPTHIHDMFTPEELQNAQLSDGFGFTKGAKLLKVPVIHSSPMNTSYGPGVLLESETRLFDLANDPGQASPMQNPELETEFCIEMARMMAALEAPSEAYERIEITSPVRGN